MAVSLLFLSGKVAGDLGKLLVGIPLGELVHDGGGLAAALEIEQLLQAVSVT